MSLEASGDAFVVFRALEREDTEANLAYKMASGRCAALCELKATITCGKRPYFWDFTDASRLKKRVESPTSKRC